LRNKQGSDDLINEFKKLYLETTKGQKSGHRQNKYVSIDVFATDQFNLATVLIKLLTKILKEETAKVDFLKKPLEFFHIFAHFREFLLKILEDSVSSFGGDESQGLFGYSRLQEKELENGKKIIDAYLNILFLNSLYPSLKKFITSEWNPKDHPELKEFFNKWQNLMEHRLFIHILIAFIEPSLKIELEDVTSQSIETHSLFNWISPWMELFSDLSNQYDLKIGESLRVTVRLKLMKILKDWHPSNSILTQEIQKWRYIYDENSWTGILSQSIIPKLSHHLNKLKVNPKNQQIEPISWMLKWSSQIGTDKLADMVGEKLLPNWLKTLQKWLENPEADLEEIMEWYQGWKGLFPQKVVEHEKVNKFFNGALQLINSKL
jgi:hypothetical protein